MICPRCQSEAAPGARFCPDCGAPLPVAAPRQDETRLVTVLFADMAGSVATTHDLDPEEALERVNAALEVMSRAVVAHGGRVDRYLGDGLLALFGVPRGREDDPLRKSVASREAPQPTHTSEVGRSARGQPSTSDEVTRAASTSARATTSRRAPVALPAVRR